MQKGVFFVLFAGFRKNRNIYKNKNCSKLDRKFLSRFARTIASQYDKNYIVKDQNCSIL